MTVNNFTLGTATHDVVTLSFWPSLDNDEMVDRKCSCDVS